MGVFFVIGIPGMIITSITNHEGAAITFGLVAAVAALCLIAVTAAVVDPAQQVVPSVVAIPGTPPAASAPAASEPAANAPARSAPAGTDDTETQAEALEDRIEALVADGADEAAVRDLVRAAVRMARTRA